MLSEEPEPEGGDIKEDVDIEDAPEPEDLDPALMAELAAERLEDQQTFEPGDRRVWDWRKEDWRVE